MSEVHFIGGSATPDDRLEDHALYFNREISWLAFNRRVLEEALDPTWPLLERLKFLSIFHSNLDEFFMIRVSGLHEQLEASVTERSADGLSAPEQLRLIREIVERDASAAMQALREDLQPKLAEAGVRVLRWKEIEPERRKELTAYFENVVFPVLTPLAFDPAHPFPFVSNLSLSLAVELREKKEKNAAFARVKVPASLSRFVPVPGAATKDLEFLLLEELVEAHLERLFPGMEILGASAFRVTRDADIEIREDEAGDLLRNVVENVRRRRFGAAIRLEVESRCPEAVRELLRTQLELEPDDVYAIDGPLGAADFLSVLKLDLPELKDAPYLPGSRSLFEPPADVFETIRKGDVLLHHPYDSFDPVLRFLETAAADQDVLAIKMTLYRTGADSPIVAALARAAENGKQVAVLVELKARFDEENNIQWARSLERAGVHVAYGVEGLKTHAKIALVVRREGTTMRRYVHVGTGNYNAATARVYTDLGLFTARADFGHDATELFNFLTGFSKKTKYRRLSVAPFSLHEKVLALIDREAEKAREGKPSAIMAKMNALVDPTVIRALYRASQAGVPIELAIRGICCLRPGVPGVSDEHPRLERRRPLPRAQPRLLLRRRRRGGDLHLQRRLDAPQLLPPGRADDADPGREGQGEDPPGGLRADRCRTTAAPATSRATAPTSGVSPASGERASDTQQDLLDKLVRRGLKAVPAL